ncbi:MAG: BolA/IbaG family iron-sulfur metabolism protein [Haloferacaceae archaeon]
METARVARLIEEGVEGAEVVHAERTPHPGEDEHEHFAVEVVAPAFEGVTIVNRHEMVYDALGDHMTTDIHALDVTTYTPDEWAERAE